MITSSYIHRIDLYLSSLHKRVMKIVSTVYVHSILIDCIVSHTKVNWQNPNSDHTKDIKTSLIILNGLYYVATTKEHSTIVVRNYGDSCESWRCSYHHKQCKKNSNDHSRNEYMIWIFHRNSCVHFFFISSHRDENDHKIKTSGIWEVQIFDWSNEKNQRLVSNTRGY